MNEWDTRLDLAEEHVDEVVKGLLSDPLCRRFIQRYLVSGDNKVYSAEDVLGERIMRVAGYVAAERKDPGSVITGEPEPGTSRLKSLLGVASLALSAMPYLWTEEVRQACRAVKVPRHVISPKSLPAPRTWHTFETGIGLEGHLVYGEGRYSGTWVDALLVCDTGKGFQCFHFGEMQNDDTKERAPIVSSAHIEYGLTYPDDIADEGLRTMAEGVLTMFAFLNSPYIPKTQHRPSRAARREAERMGSPIEDDALVTFVVLRRPENRRHKNEEEGSVDWKHRWLVNGHVRAQWYPSEQAHRLIWIAPYLKGPEDAPMLTHAYKVAR